MNDVKHDYHAIIARAQTGQQAEENAIHSLGLAYFKASVSGLGMVMGCVSEAAALTIALHAAYPALSTGQDLGSEMLSMRWSLIAGLLLGHAILHDSTDATARPMRRVIRKLKVIPILAVICGIALFQFTTAQTTGGDGQGGIGATMLGLAMAGLFAISFMACNRLTGSLLRAIRAILDGRAQRAKLSQIKKELDAAGTCRSRIAALQADIAHRDKPDALRWQAAEEAAMVVGQVAAEAHDHHASSEALGDDIRPEDEVLDLLDTPVLALAQRSGYLKSLDVAHFHSILVNRKEA